MGDKILYKKIKIKWRVVGVVTADTHTQKKKILKFDLHPQLFPQVNSSTNLCLSSGAKTS